MVKRSARKVRLRASLGPKVLGNVDRYFTNDLRVIAMELLQNARRAGARRVDVTSDHATGYVAVSDDGRGIATDQAGILLAFGGSANEPVTEHDEAPAGMGFFSLARRGAAVASNDWRIVIPEEAFVGAGDAEPPTGLPPVTGTVVTFPADPIEAVRAFSEAAAAMPFETFIDGRVVRRWRSIDRLTDAKGRTTATQVTSRTVDDCSIVVARFEDGRTRAVGRSPYDSVVDDAWLEVTFDIFGQIIRLAEDDIARLHPALAAPAETALWVRVPHAGDGWIRRQPKYLAVVEAFGSRTLVPRLPDRGALVRTEGLDAIGDAIAAMVTTLVAQAPANSLPQQHRLRAVRGAAAVRPPQAVAFRPRRRSRNTTSGFATGPDGVPETHRPVLVVESGTTTFRDPRLPDAGVLALPPHGPLFSMLLAADAGQGGGIAAGLVEGDVPGLSTTLVVRGPR